MHFLKRQKQRLLHSMIAPLILWAALFACSLSASFYIENVIEKRCFSTLEEATKQGASDFRIIFEGKEQYIQVLSSMLANRVTLDADACRTCFNALEKDSLVTSFSVLLPDGEMVYSRREVTMEETPVFEDEADKEPYFTSAFTDAASGEKYCAYVSPIKRSDEVRGILYGYVKLSALSGQITIKAFGNQSQMYLVDEENGDFLMDTWHDELGNFYDDDLSSRKSKGGTSLEQAREDLINGKTGYVIFESATTGDDFYTCFTPVGIYDLSFQLTVSRSVAFADYVVIQRVVYVLCAAQILICMIGFFYFWKRARRKTAEAQRRLELNRAMNEADQMLFGAYKNPWMINEALSKISHVLGAGQMVFSALEDGVVEKLFSWPVMSEEHRSALLGRSLVQDSPEIYQLLKENSTFFLEKPNEDFFPAEFLPAGLKEFTNLAAAGITSPDGSVIGILSAVNISHTMYAEEALKRIIRSFQLTVQIMDSYHFVHQMGSVDALTGLKNRNAYQHELENVKSFETGSFCCVYIDANGLHDLNNQFGHAAGDKMLKSIGSLMAEMFGQTHTYRIGGDEFVILGSDLDPEDMESRLTVFADRLAKMDYFVSVGCAFRENDQPVQQVILSAEKKMYAQKKEFYSGDRDRRKARQLNQGLENLLMEKRDQDSFLAAISASYLGVYVVNLDAGDTRVIFRTDYFAEILEDNEYLFRSSVREYARNMVAEEDFDKVIDLLNFEPLARQMKEGLIVERIYRKTDGTQVRIRVLPKEDYSDSQKNTLWIFENYRTQADGQTAGNA